MPDASGSYVRGLLLAQEIVPSATHSSYQEGSPIAGYPVPGRAAHGRLVASGTPTGTMTVEARCQHGGTAGQVDHGPTMATRRLGEPLWQGSEQPGSLAGWEQIDFADTLERPVIASLGTTLVHAAEDGVQIRIHTRALGAASWTNRGVLPGYAAWLAYPCLVVVGDEIYCLAWRSAATWSGATLTAVNRYIGSWRSADGGVTWEVVQDFATVEEDVLDDTVTPAGAGTTYSCGRIDAAYRDGQVSVFAHLRARALNDELDRVRQWAGASLTARLDLIGTFASTGRGWGLPSVTATPWGFAVAWLEYGGGTDGAYVCSIGSAWQAITTTVPVLLATSAPYDIDPETGWSAVGAGTAKTYEDNDAAECTLVWDPAGVLWWLLCCNVAAVGAGNQYAYYSADGGTTWHPGHASRPAATDVSGYWYWPHDTGALGVAGTQGHRPNQCRAIWHLGRIAVAHVGYSTTAGCYAAVAYLGGWSDLTLPYERDGVRIGDRVGWLRAVLPIEVAASGDYTVATAGTYTRALVTPGMERHTTGDGAGATGQDFCNFVGVDNNGEMHGLTEYQLAVDQGGSSVACEIGIRMRLASPTHGCEVEVCHTSTGIYVRDYVAGAALGSAAGLIAGTVYQVRLGMAMTSDAGVGRGVQVWYRALDREPNRRWTRIGSWTLQDDAGGGGITPWVKFGHIVAGGNVTQNQSKWIGPWMTIPYAATGSTAGTLGTWHDLNQTGGDNPGKLPGRPLGTEGNWCLDGVTLAGRRGPFLIGDTWTVPIRGEYAIDRAVSRTYPSPRIPFRSASVAAPTIVAWAADTDNPWLEDCGHAPLVGVGLYGTNARRIRVDSRSAAGAWTTRYDAATFVLPAVGFTRQGNAVIPAGGATTTWLHKNECAGWYALLDNGAGTLRYRRILGNDAGRWSAAGIEPMPRLYLDGIVTTDPAGGVGQALSIWPDSAVVLFPGVTCAGWRVYLDNTYLPLESYYQIGALVFGPVHLFGLQPSWGRAIEQTPGHERVDLEGGVPYTTTRGPAGRVVTVGWDDGVDTSEVYDTTAVRYVTPSTAGGTAPNASLAGTPGDLRLTLARHQGNPVVYLPRLARTAASTFALLRPDEHMLATIADGPKLQPFLGDELTSEVQRVATVELAEIK